MNVTRFGEKPVMAFSPGIYPRSEALVQATRDLDRGRTTAEAVTEQAAGDRRRLLEAQEAAGLDLLSDGMLDWQDLFRPIAERCDGVEARPLTRFLDTNTFYRALIVDGRVRLREPIPAPGLPAGSWLGTLPSPYALSRAAGGEAEPEALAAEVLAPQIEAWAEAGAALVVLDEPFAAREPGSLPRLVSALRELPERDRLVLRLVFGDAGPALARADELPVGGLGVDVYATALESVPHGLPLLLLAGVVDVRSSAIESPAELASFAGSLLERRPRALALGPNGDLQFVPEPIARQKLEVLGEAKKGL